jgi:predicted HicB family RNase H-like nuclease
VDSETKRQLSEMAAREGISESDVIRGMIEREFRMSGGRGGAHIDGSLPASKDGYERKKITLTIPSFIVDLARERASQKGMSLSRWIASLIQSHVFQPPVLTITELKYLNESNRQIRGMGVNLNQIAKAFNKMDIDIRKFKNLDVVEALVRENLAVIERLMRAANRSWGVGRLNH